jgi:ribosomal protein S18 acetylase RimI-like enzyme
VSVAVRPATPDEYDAVAELTARVYLTEGHGGPDYEPALRSVASRAASATVLVAVDDGRLVGAVTVATRGGEWAEQAGPGEAVIRMLVVDPAARSSGVGEALVQACLAEARSADCLRVRLSSGPEMKAAHRLYERVGFERAPSYDWCPVPGVRLLGYVLEL